MAEGDRLSRSELAVVLQRAADIQARKPAEQGVSLADAELLAAEVGITAAEFREAVRLLRSQRDLDPGWLGPGGSLAAEAALPHGVREAEALHMLAQAQVVLPSPGASIDAAAPGLWRLADRNGSLVQISTRGETTMLSASVDRKRARIGLIGGGTIVGTILGMIIVPTAAMLAWGTVEALAVSNAVGIIVGAAAGLGGGAAAWKATARRTHARLLAALDRMRAVGEEHESAKE